MKENEIFKNLRKEIQNIKLNPEEKAGILERVTSTPLHSPYAPIRSMWVFRMRTFVYVVASLLVLILSGSGVAYASLYALPGEGLYAVKVKVTEPVLDVLAFTPVVRAERKAQKVVRRLNEAEKLILKDDFTLEHKIELEKRFNKDADDFNTAVELIEKDSLDKKEKLKADLEVSLNTYVDTIQKISIEKSTKVEVAMDKEKKEDTEVTKDAKIDIKSNTEVNKESSTNTEVIPETKIFVEEKTEIKKVEKSEIISDFGRVVKDRIILNKNINTEKEIPKEVSKEIKTEIKKDIILDVKTEDIKSTPDSIEPEIKLEIIDEKKEIKEADTKILPLIPQIDILKIN